MRQSEIITPLFKVPPTPLIPGTELINQGVYLFQCPLCKKHFRYDDAYGPVCTGPSETLDEHPPEAMRLIGKVPPKIIV